MILVEPKIEIMQIMCESFGARKSLDLIEDAGRTCYKSERKEGDSSSEFVRGILKKGHESVIEHSAMTVRVICDRGVTHEIVRHRLAAYSQESTRYCNYAKNDQIEVIEPYFFDPYEPVVPIYLPIPICTSELFRRNGDGIKFEFDEGERTKVSMNSFDVWFVSCLYAEWAYMTLINVFHKTPQEARSVLPNSLKTEIVITANFREWRHIFKLRTSKKAHPQMREIMVPLLREVQSLIPVIFEDIQP